MAKINSYTELKVWQKAMEAAEQCFRLTDHLPSHVRFELTNQIRRAAISIPSNIAEGFSRHSQPAYLNHLRIALGSHAELETRLELAIRLRFLDPEQTTPTQDLLMHVARMLHGLVSSLELTGEAIQADVVIDN